MNCDDTFHDSDDSDFQRWYFGGSPPDLEDRSNRSFEEAMSGARVTKDSLNAHRPFANL